MDKEKLNKIKKELNLGATGIYQKGKLYPSDEGELRSALVKDGDKILIIFGKPVEWVALTKESAKSLGIQLVMMADK